MPIAIGVVAGALSTASFAPQVLKAWREGDTAAISLRMYIVTVIAFAMWIVYGVMIGSLPIIVFNALSLFMSGSILVMKIRNGPDG
jgi:MtN3 and saliva related transmembrane protein